MNIPSYDVAITTYKRPEFAKRAIESCLNQGDALNKVIVVDDASNDDTEEVISKIGDKRILYYKRLENGGMGVARRDALMLSDSDWTIILDSDWELLPGAIEELIKLNERADGKVGLLGGRIRWDTGIITPQNVPNHCIDYKEQVNWRSRSDGLGMDNLACISREVRNKVQWPNYRSQSGDVLFYLDVGKAALAIYTDKELALQYSNAPAGYSRGRAKDRLETRKLESSSGIEVCDLILNRHEKALEQWGPKLLAEVFQKGAMHALLSGKRTKSLNWAIRSIQLGGLTVNGIGLLFSILGGKRVFEFLYLLRK